MKVGILGRFGLALVQPVCRGHRFCFHRGVGSRVRAIVARCQ